MRRGPRGLAFAVGIAVGASSVASAGDWEVELHGGGLFTFPGSSGRVTTPPRGEPFQTLVPGVSSLRVTSWYFGDGGRLSDHFGDEAWLFEHRQSNLAKWGSDTWQYYLPVLPLDRMLSSAALAWPVRGNGGLRLGRRLSRRLSAEVGIEYGGHAPGFSEAARTDIESSRLSFEESWSRTLSSLPGARVASQASVREGSGRQWTATGVININLQTGDPPKWSRRPPRRRFVTFLTLGAGIVSTNGTEASATLVGRYRFAAPATGAAAFEETDAVTIRSFQTSGTSVVGVFGLGWKQDLSTRWGLRFDARTYLGRNPTRIVVDTRPSVTTLSPASAYVVESSTGAIQFVNSSSGIDEGPHSSLSGPALTGFETFKGTGISWQINLTLGVFLRF